jgi:hypothetical protein
MIRELIDTDLETVAGGLKVGGDFTKIAQDVRLNQRTDVHSNVNARGFGATAYSDIAAGNSATIVQA